MADVELRELQLFLVLAEELHFGRTAERLGLTPSRVSQTVRALERKLGGPRLFDRTSRVVTLTEAGAALRRDLVPALANLDEVMLRARERGAGPGLLTVGVLNAASGVAASTGQSAASSHCIPAEPFAWSPLRSPIGWGRCDGARSTWP